MPPQQDSICAYLRLSGVNLRNYKTRAPKDCAKRGRAPKPHGKFPTRKAGIFVNITYVSSRVSLRYLFFRHLYPSRRKILPQAKDFA